MTYKEILKKNNLVIAIFLFVSLTASITLLVGQYFYGQALSSAQTRLALSASSRSNQFEKNIAEAKRNVAFIESVPPVAGITRAMLNNGIDTQENTTLALWDKRLKTIFSGYLKTHPDVFQIRFIGVGSNGHELVRVERNQKNDIEVIPDSALQIKGDTTYFKETIKLKEGETYISDIDLNKEHGIVQVPHIQTLRISTPVYTAAGQVFGIIVININVEPLLNSLSSSLAPGFQLYLTNSDGDYIEHPNTSLEFGFDLGKRHRWQDDFSLETDSKNNSTTVNTFKSNNGLVFSASKNIALDENNKNRYLIIHTVLPKAIIMSGVHDTQLLVIILTLIIMLFFYLLFYIYKKNRILLENEQVLLAAIVESSLDAIIGKTLNGVVTSWNKGAEIIFGYTPGEAIGKKLADLIVPADAMTEEMSILSKISRGEKIPHFNTSRHRKDGSLIDVSATVSPVRDAHGNIIGASKTVRDITTEKTMERELLRLNNNLEEEVRARTIEIQTVSELHNAILQNADSAIIGGDKECVINVFNPAAEKMLGYRADEIIGLTPAIFHDMDEVVARAHEFSIELGETIHPGVKVFTIKAERNLPNKYEWTYICKDGSQLRVLLAVSALRNKQNEITGYLGVAQDISQQYADKQKLLLMSQHLQKAADVAELGIWRWDVKSNALEWNQQMFDIYDLPKEQQENGLYYEHWRALVHPDDFAETEAKLFAAVAGAGVYDPVFRVVRPNGDIRFVKANAVVEYDKNGEAITVLGINRDITFQKNYEHSLSIAKIAADNANRAKSEFLANMSHEIRTPMNAVLGLLQLLQQTSLDARQMDYINKSTSAARTLLDILNNILDFSKIEAGKLSLDINTFNIDKLFSDIGVILGANIGNKNIEILFDIDPQISNLIIGDELRLKQILINLSGNSIKFTNEGEIILSLKLIHRDDNSAPMMHISVRDTGIGISEEAQQRIFDAFSQAENSTARHFGGSGLGLAICKRLIHLMGGELKVESALGKGSNFYFDIPYTPADDKKVISHHSLSLNNLNVLIIDDNESARKILSKMASDFTWNVDEANDGLSALAILENAKKMGKKYDVILVDWRMPDIDGWDLSLKIRQLYGNKEAPILVMITAHGRESIENKHYENPDILNGFLTKPLTASMLFDAVATARNVSSSQASVDKTTMEYEQSLAGLHILLVEDNETNQMVASELLQSRGAQVEVISSGELAVIKLEMTIDKTRATSSYFDLVLMDIQMPGMDGYTATRIIRQDLKLLDIPIIAMTANVMQPDRDAALAAGMNDHIPKPFDIAKVVDVILHYTNKTNGEKPDAITEDITNDDLHNILDTDAALSRFGKNKKLYGKAIHMFVSDTEKQVAHIAQMLSNNQQQADIRIALHTLKGFSATVGAAHLAALAGSMEQKSVGELNAALPMLEKAAKKAVQTALEYAALHSVIEEPHPVPSVMPLQSKQELINLKQLLLASDMKAVTVCDDLVKRYASIFPDNFTHLIDLVTRLKFKEAIDICDDLLKKVEARNK